MPPTHAKYVSSQWRTTSDEADLGVPVPQVPGVQPDQLEGEFPPGVVERAEAQALVGHHHVVLELLCVGVVSGLVRVDDGDRALLVVERVDQREAGGQLLLEDRRTGVGTRVGPHRLGAHERRREHDLVAQDEAVHDRDDGRRVCQPQGAVSDGSPITVNQ